jgi:hypothetical protein
MPNKLFKENDPGSPLTIIMPKSLIAELEQRAEEQTTEQGRVTRSSLIRDYCRRGLDANDPPGTT